MVREASFGFAYRPIAARRGSGVLGIVVLTLAASFAPSAQAEAPSPSSPSASIAAPSAPDVSAAAPDVAAPPVVAGASQPAAPPVSAGSPQTPASASTGAPPSPVPPVSAGATRSPMAPPPEVGSSSTDSGFGPQRVLALLSAGLGVAFATVGVVAYFDAKSERDESRAYCKNDVCSDRRGLDLTTEAVNDGNLATAGTIAGAVGVALGALLWFTAPGPSPEETHVGLGAGRVVVRGSF